MDTEQKYKDGVYKSENATYLIKDGKILMKLEGKLGWYKTNINFMQGEYYEELPEHYSSQFDDVYNQVNKW